MSAISLCKNYTTITHFKTLQKVVCGTSSVINVPKSVQTHLRPQYFKVHRDLSTIAHPLVKECGWVNMQKMLMKYTKKMVRVAMVIVIGLFFLSRLSDTFPPCCLRTVQSN